MFDVGQNTGRIDALLATYYKAEAELESATEAKLGLTMQGASNAKQKNEAENAIIDKYNQLIEDALAGKVGEVDGVEVPFKIMGESKVLDQETFENMWKGAHHEPQKSDAKYTPIQRGTGEYTHKTPDAFKSQAKSECGSAPSQGDYTKKEKDADGNEKTVPDTDAYNRAKSEYDKKVNQRAEDLAKRYNDEMDAKCDRYNEKLEDQYDKDHDKWENDKTKATNQAAAYVDAMNGNSTKLSKQRDDEMRKLENDWDSINQQLNADECALDQIAQRAQAVVTATKAEIESLKSERNSNAQSDFKLFG